MKKLFGTFFSFFAILGAHPGYLRAQAATPTPNCCQTTMVYGTGTPGSSANQLDFPQRGVVVGSNPVSFYVADTNNNRISVFNQATGAPLTQITNAGFMNPRSVALAGNNLFMVGSGSATLFVVDTAGGNSVTGYPTGMSDTESVAVNASGTTVAVSSNLNNQVQIFNYTGSALNLAQSLTTVSGLHSIGLAMDSSDNLFTVYTGSAYLIAEYAYSPTTGYSSNPVTVIQGGNLNNPHDIAVDGCENLYIANALSYQVYNPAGQFLTSCSSSGGVAFNTPQGISLDSANNIYLGDTDNQRVIQFSACMPMATPTPGYAGSNPPAQGSCFIYPSPVRGGQATLSYNMASGGQMDLRILNENGELALHATDSKGAGVQVTPLNLAPLVPGIYYYVVTLTYNSGSVDRIKTQKFAVVR